MSLVQIIVVMQEVNGMSKSQDYRKNKKTAPKKTAKEKKQAKREKKNKEFAVSTMSAGGSGPWRAS